MRQSIYLPLSCWSRWNVPLLTTLTHVWYLICFMIDHDEIALLKHANSSEGPRRIDHLAWTGFTPTGVLMARGHYKKSIASGNQQSLAFPIQPRLISPIARMLLYYIFRSAFVTAILEQASEVFNCLFHPGTTRRLAWQSSQKISILLRPRIPIDVIEFRIFKIFPLMLMFLLTAILPPFPKNLHLLGTFLAALITPLTSQLLASSSTIMMYLLMLRYLHPDNMLSLPLMWVPFQVQNNYSRTLLSCRIW